MKDSKITINTWNQVMLIDELAEQFKDVIQKDLIYQVITSLEKNIENHLLSTQADTPINVKLFTGLTITGRIKPQRSMTVAGRILDVDEQLKVTAKISRYFSKKLNQHWIPFQNITQKPNK